MKKNCFSGYRFVSFIFLNGLLTFIFFAIILLVQSGADANLRAAEENRSRSENTKKQTLPPTKRSVRTFIISDDRTEAAIDEFGRLVSLKNRQTGTDYAGGESLWRLYYDKNTGELENQLTEKNCRTTVSKRKQSETDPNAGAKKTSNTAKTAKEFSSVSGNERAKNSVSGPSGQKGSGAIRIPEAIVIHLDHFKDRGKDLKFELELTITIQDGFIRFASKLKNNEPHTIIRELQYPLIGDLQIPKDIQLLTTTCGGQLFPNPVGYINGVGNRTSYAAPAQFFRDASVRYPGATASNCFVLTGEKEGLYFGSHDYSFQDTIHGLRVYPDPDGQFNKLEGGLYKYPNCLCGRIWSNTANVVAPYSGSWHEASRIYRKWVNTWWHQRPVPHWVQLMKGWQRIIFTHQYGEQLFSIADLNGKVKRIGREIDLPALMAFGWWRSGMDNGYPDSYFQTDPRQGGDAAWKKAIADFQKDGGKFLIYFNGKLIDRTSPFYTSGQGAQACYSDNTGGEYQEQYRFPAFGTFTGYLNARSFVTADLRHPAWKKMLLKMADRGLELGAASIFYDQLGYAESSSNWDTSGEFPIPNLFLIKDKADALKMIHDYLDSKNVPEIALGTEHFTDVVAQYADYIHSITGATGIRDFIDWTRFTFPEIVMTDRTMRDDSDAVRRVNHTLLKGLRNNVEIYRCRDLIDKAPNFKKQLTAINKIREKYPDLLLRGIYRDTEGFSSANPAVQARAFDYQDDLAIVVTQSVRPMLETVIKVPGKKFETFELIGDGSVVDNQKEGQKIILKKDSLAVLVYRK